MRIWHFTNCLAALVLALSASCLRAQEGMTLRFLAFPKSPAPQPVELLVGEGKTILVDTPGHELSTAYRVPVMGMLSVGKTIQSEEGGAVFESYGSAKALGVREQIVLLLRKGEAHSDGFVVLPVDASSIHFSGASFLFLNASSLDVAGLVGDQKLVLKPGQTRLVKPSPSHKDSGCQVTFSYLRKDKWKTIFDTRWPASDKFRSIVFFYQDPKTGRLGIAPIVDVLPYKAN